VYNLLVKPRAAIPLVRGWNRLEGRPRTADFQRSLRAEVRDPLWFLTRQWQYGEFEGEDAGSPIDARIGYHTAVFNTYEAGEARLPYDPGTPLEVRVEREPVPFDLTLHMQASRVFERLLKAEGHGSRLSDYVTLFPLDYVTGVAGAHSADARALAQAGKQFLFDTSGLLNVVRDGTHATRIAGLQNLTTAEAHHLVDAGRLLLAWYERTYSQPDGEPSAWQPDRLAYGFGCSADEGAVRLSATNHRGGDLDWHAFDAVTVATQPTATPAATALSFLPTTIRFAGMPSPRFWEMEDSRTDFGRLDVDKQDLAKMLLAEFILLYSNDWCVLPIELPVGTFTRIEGLLVTDVFGDQMLVRAADRGADSDWQRWSMFRLEGDAADRMGLLLAPTLTETVESPPIEQVEFLRDEMANMVWAVEHRVASKLGDPLNPEISDAALNGTVAGAGARYTLGTTVRSNWRPFIPAHLPGSTRSIRLQRARLPHQPPEPLGEILNQPAPYFIAEEEVPRAGRTVTRTFHRARWIDGRTFLWIGRGSPVGRGETSSGLVFDRIDE
jgi:hypothetical protein